MAKATQIAAEGRAKFADFDKNFENAVQAAAKNPTLANIYQHAILIGNANAVNDIMTNAAKRGRMLDDPTCWDKEIFNMGDATSNKDVKLPPEPLDEIKTTSAPGKRSYAEQRRHVLIKNGEM